MKLLGNLKRGLLFVVSAPGGTGKTTLVKKLTTEFPSVVASVSCTTRSSREKEVDGIDYHFLSQDQFKAKIDAGEFLEYVTLFGHSYGTSRYLVEEQLAAGKHVVLVIDTQGARILARTIPVVTIFIKPPTMEALRQRLHHRRTEDVEALEARLKLAEKELKLAAWYDYQVVNDDLATAYVALKSIFIAEEHRSLNL